MNNISEQIKNTFRQNVKNPRVYTYVDDNSLTVSVEVYEQTTDLLVFPIYQKINRRLFFLVRFCINKL